MVYILKNGEKELRKCKYGREKEIKYFNFEFREIRRFVCPRDAVIDGYCIFHHQNYWREHEGEVREAFMNLLERGETKFIGFNLPDIDLSKRTFPKNIYFTHTKFHGKTNFNKARFQGTADFSNAQFTEGTYFVNAKFHEMPHFLNTSFLKTADFSEAEFVKGADFTRAVFEKDAHFPKSRFWSITLFSDAIFLGRTSFSEALFEKKTDFSKAIFTKIVHFSNVIFKEEVYFRKTIFWGLANFSRTTFSEVDFYKAIFSGDVDFTGAIFEGVAYFGEVLFLGSVRFDGVRFLGYVSFKDADFSPDFLANCLDPYKMISFRRVSFEVQKNVIFDGTDMRRVSFIHVDLERVRFRNIEWKGYYDGKLLILKNSWRERKKFFKEKKKKYLEMLLNSETKLKKELGDKFWRLYAEIELIRTIPIEIFGTIGIDTTRLNVLKQFLDKDRWKKEIKETLLNFNKLRSQYDDKLIRDADLTLDNVLSVLRGLRENYDYYLKYEGSGKFFVEEMDLKRKLAFKRRNRSIFSSLASFAESLILLFYRWLCLYGESVARPIIWIPVIILTFALAPAISLFFSAIPKLLLGQLSFLGFIKFLLEHWNSNTPKFFLTRLKTSAEAFFQLRWDGKITTLIERLISIPALGSLYISLRRKLERKIRH